MEGLTFHRANKDPLLFETAKGQIHLSIDVELPDQLAIFLQAGGSAMDMIPEDKEKGWPAEEVEESAMFNTEYLTIAPEDLPGTGPACLDGYHLTYSGPGDPSSDSPALLYHYEHLGATKLDMRLSYQGGATYHCDLDVTNEVGDRLAGQCALTFKNLSVHGLTRADDPAFDALADQIMGTTGTRRRVTQPLGTENEQYFLFVDLNT